jgi:hypothetical protein
MERSESVNAANSGEDMPVFEGFPASDEPIEESIAAPISIPSGDQGPCLYLGPAGQRCDRRAFDGGFCARHQPGGSGVSALSLPQISRRGAAVIGLLAVLWPVLADVVREIIRLLR